MKEKQTSFSDRVVKFFCSLKLAFVLIFLLGLLVSQKAIIAQKALMPKEGMEPPLLIKILNSLGIASPDSLDILFYMLLALFVLNLGFASSRMIRRIMAKKRALNSYKTGEAIRALENHTEFTIGDSAEEKLTEFLNSKGFRVQLESSGDPVRMYAGKRDAGRWGVFFFHMTFFILFLGILLSISTRQAGYVEIAPGETFIEKRGNYLNVSKPPQFLGHDSMFRLQLEDIDLSYWRPGVIKQRASIVQLYDKMGDFIGKKLIEVNSPLKFRGTTVYQGSWQGFRTGLDITDTEGNISTGTARFYLPKKTGQEMKNTIDLPGTGLGLVLELFTEKLGEIEGLEQLGARSMATLIKVTSVGGGPPVFRGVVFSGSTLTFEGLTIHFKSIKPFTSFVVVRDHGIPVIFAGFVFLLIGLVVTYFWVPENYWALIKKETDKSIMIIGAATERYKDSFEDRFEEHMNELKKELFK